MRKLLLAAAACAAAMALASCASLQHSWDQGNVETVAKLINGGQSAKLAAMSATPFLVDGEVVTLKNDIAGFWEGIIKAGYKVEGPALGEAAPVTADSYKQFADTMEVKSFFAEYVKKDTRVLELRTGAGGRILLIIRDSWFSKTIQGFKGPF
ncbi:MAG: hypothetical protein ABSG85_14930 [Spirochaetia bacterium]|jgi:hypothetical protein